MTVHDKIKNYYDNYCKIQTMRAEVKPLMMTLKKILNKYKCKRK